MGGNSVCLLIGIHSVASALSNMPGQVRVIRIAQESHNPRVRKLASLAGELGISVVMEPRALLERRSEGQRHQDIIAEFAAENLLTEKDLDRVLDSIDGPPLLLVLDGVQDPHNLGACIRTAEAAGVHAVILPRDRSAGLTPVVRRVASGAAEVLPILIVTNLAAILRRIKEKGVWLLGTSDQAKQSLYEVGMNGPMALVMGNEEKGMRRLTSELCDFLVQIPMHGSVSSLNISVATGVCLFEMIRQRGEE
ncbi:MAG: 23S rRNA (guanosine(2251)-2'-O)-methyltransferase RlmB [Proteobacteria bacterium]|nr:23S rRNA (guanosine(2251)-2'-O)-methyltransferase RlmB [Pseudomonadota bacterium]